MGHEKRGAVAGAIGTTKLPGHIEDLVNIIRTIWRQVKLSFIKQQF